MYMDIYNLQTHTRPAFSLGGIEYYRSFSSWEMMSQYFMRKNQPHKRKAA